MKSECPLCKRRLEFVKHQLKIASDERPAWEHDGTLEEIEKLRSEFEMSQILSPTSYPAELEKKAVVAVIAHLFNEMNNLNKHSYSSVMPESYQKLTQSFEQEINDYNQLYSKFSTRSRCDIFNEPAFRRVIYLRNLMPRSICPPTTSIAFSPDYVRNNQKLVRKHLAPYLIREITAITRKNSISLDEYLDIIIKYFMNKANRFDVVTFLNKRGIKNPHQFLNNLTHYLTAGQSLKVYDQNSEYVPRSANSNYLPVYQPDDDDVMVIHHTNLSNDVQVLGEYVGNGVPLHSQRNARDIQRDNGDTNTQQHERGINSDRSIRRTNILAQLMRSDMGPSATSRVYDRHPAFSTTPFLPPLPMNMRLAGVQVNPTSNLDAMEQLARRLREHLTGSRTNYNSDSRGTSSPPVEIMETNLQPSTSSDIIDISDHESEEDDDTVEFVGEIKRRKRKHQAQKNGERRK